MSIFSFIKSLFVRKPPKHPENCECPPCEIGRYRDKNEKEFFEKEFKPGDNINIKIPDYPRIDK